METRLHAIKLLHDNGIIESVDSGIVIIKKGESLEFEAVNVLPFDQLLLTGVVFHSLFHEYIVANTQEGDMERTLGAMLSEFIKILLDTDKTKGDVLA